MVVEVDKAVTGWQASDPSRQADNMAGKLMMQVGVRKQARQPALP